jgi:hypothetical protein
MISYMANRVQARISAQEKLAAFENDLVAERALWALEQLSTA